MAVSVKLSDIKHLLTPEQVRELSLIPDKLPPGPKSKGCDFGPLPKMPGAKTRELILPASGKPGPWSVLIPKWHPLLDNKMMYKNHHVVKRLKQADVRRLFFELLAAGVPRATGKRRLTLTLTYRRGQIHCDPFAPFKSLNDALTKIGAWKDDNREWSSTNPLRYGEPGLRRETLIYLEDVPHE